MKKIHVWFGKFKTEKELKKYLDQNGLPTVQSVAENLNVTPRYLSDLLRNLIGLNTQQFIHEKVITKAKEYLTKDELTIAEIAYHLGFEHPQSFNKLFKSKTSLSPSDYKKSLLN
ncbi:helix-turn-helix domain-containing protein [Sphingobacterium puteale]|uniref:helix-turn-helix domain-containing protein n=1 Tax=Sphingobacterium puteale TaxID=2420510 RepID=UPI003D970CE5